ncbi:hypothetical protein, partial [uncultured Rikenella sp.]|uniref:hypothetical protein n=1 Tax=uncultured Rikenella sp. TaxID=368003 RepID=UPI0025D127F8
LFRLIAETVESPPKAWRAVLALFESPAAILVGWPSANQQNMPFYAGGRRASFVLAGTAAFWKKRHQKLL